MHLIGGIILVALSGTLALTFGDALAATQNDSFTLSILESYVSSGKADLHDEYHAIVIPEMSNAVLILPDTPLGELRTRYHYGGDKGAGEQFNSAIRNLTTQNIHQRQSGSTWYVTGYTYTYTCSYTTSYTWSGDWLWNGCVNYVNSGGTSYPALPVCGHRTFTHDILNLKRNTKHDVLYVH
jgi:hypothetical protein